MTSGEAEALAATLHATGNGHTLRAVVNGEWITFTGGSRGVHSLAFAVSSPARVLAHWSGYAASNGVQVAPVKRQPEPARKTSAQLDREIAAALQHPPAQPVQAPTIGKQRVRRMAVVTFWGRSYYKAGGEQKLVEFWTSDRFARAWNSSGQRFNKSYEIDTHDKGKAFGGYVREDGSIDPRYPAQDEPSHGVKSIRPATLKDLKRFKFKLPLGHTLAERID